MLSQNDISRIAVGGGPTETVVVFEPQEQAADVALGPGYVALATNQRLARVARTGGQATTLSTGLVYRVATFGDSIYFFRAVAGGGSTCANGSELVRISQAGGAATVIAAEPSPCVNELTIGGDNVFWIAGNRTVLRAATP